MEINLKGMADEYIAQVTHEAISRSFRAANALRNAELRVLRGQRSGRQYRRPHAKTTYTASAPGEPPAVRSGDLRRQWRPISESETTGKNIKIVPAINTDVKYAPYLDDGTPKMAARPYKERVIEEAKPEIMTIYSKPFLK